jgi:hypothetical protein
MTTEYTVKKCSEFGYAKSLDDVLDNYSNSKIYYLGNETNENVEKLDNLVDIEKIESTNPVIVVDLTHETFSDITFSLKSDAKDNVSGTNKNYRNDPDELRKQVANADQLNAFTSNMFTVIYGKKTANVKSVNFKQNHEVLDSLARNGVVCTPHTDEVLSMQILVDKLFKLKNFRIICIHPELELQFISHEYPSDISHPAYIIGKGEITAVFYRYIMLNFFGYCSIITESMRENSYMF